MLPRLLASLALSVALLPAQAQISAPSQDANLQSLLSALTSGSEVTLVTPLRTGQLQVTSFQPGGRLAAPDAVRLVERARTQLQALGEPQPSAEQIARMLAGGPIEVPSGRIHAAGMLPGAGRPAAIRSQIVAAGTPIPAYGDTRSAAAGGSAPASPVAARELALQQLAALGILNPSEEQIRTALSGGTIMTLNGVYELPGILPR